MMWGMMVGAFIFSLLVLISFVGFAYIIWILASRETEWIKTIGNIIAIAIVILAVTFFLYFGIYGSMVKNNWQSMYGYKMMPGMMMRK